MTTYQLFSIVVEVLFTAVSSARSSGSGGVAILSAVVWP